MKTRIAALLLAIFGLFAGAAYAGLVGDILDPLLPPHSTPELEPAVLVAIAVIGVGAYPLLKNFLKRKDR